MKRSYPLGLIALVCLSGCSSFMNGRFAGCFGGRFAGLCRNHGEVYSVAEGEENQVVVDGVAETVVQPDATVSKPDATVVKAAQGAVRIEKEEGLPEAEATTSGPGDAEPARPAAPGNLPPSGLADAPPLEQPTGMMPAGPPMDVAAGEPQIAPPEPRVQYLRNPRLRLNYEVKGASSTGLASVELYYTRDGHTWSRANVALTDRPPYVVDFGAEGRFGLTLVARSSNGTGKSPPGDGDMPQAWVEIDSTRPAVAITGVKVDASGRLMTICWNASDRNLDPRSVSLSYATDPEGPWTPIARNLDNLGHYEWKSDMDASQRVYVRVEVSDLAGNVGVARSEEPLQVDGVHPVALITKLEEAP